MEVNKVTNEDILKIVKECNLHNAVELVNGEAYLIDEEFDLKLADGGTYRDRVELIVLMKNGKKVGGIYRMAEYDVHCVIDKKYRGQHIMSNFAKKGILEKIWPENKSVKLCGIDNREQYEMKSYLASLSHLEIKNIEEIERHLAYIEGEKYKYRE